MNCWSTLLKNKMQKNSPCWIKCYSFTLLNNECGSHFVWFTESGMLVLVDHRKKKTTHPQGFRLQPPVLHNAALHLTLSKFHSDPPDHPSSISYFPFFFIPQGWWCWTEKNHRSAASWRKSWMRWLRRRRSDLETMTGF